MLSKYTAGESLEEDGDWSKESWSVLKLHSIRTYGLVAERVVESCGGGWRLGSNTRHRIA